MAKNVFVKVPSVGDAVVGNLKTKKVEFIAAKTFSLADLDTATYETIGVVYARHGKQVKIAYKHNEAKQWANKVVVEIKGAQTDGVQHTGTISYRPNAESSTNTDVVVSYTATTLQQVADAINAAITGQPVMVAQHWHSYVENGHLVMSYDYINWTQTSYNSFKDGFTMNKEYWFKDIESSTKIRCVNGGIKDRGAILSRSRAAHFYSTSVGSTDADGNVASDINNLEDRQYPINLTSYLGKSADGKDHCAALRAKYGEGEKGWFNCLRSFDSVSPTDVCGLGVRNGLEQTLTLVSYRDGYGKSIAPAAEYCLSVSTDTLPAGSFYLPTLEDLYELFSAVRYPASTIEDCPINATLQEMQGKEIRNDQHLWSCCRMILNFAYFIDRLRGTSNCEEFHNTFKVIPVSLYYLKD